MPNFSFKLSKHFLQHLIHKGEMTCLLPLLVCVGTRNVVAICILHFQRTQLFSVPVRCWHQHMTFMQHSITRARIFSSSVIKKPLSYIYRKCFNVKLRREGTEINVRGTKTVEMQGTGRKQRLSSQYPCL